MTRAEKIDAIAEIICNNEFPARPSVGGDGAQRWTRLLERAEQWPGCYSWSTVERLRNTAFEVLQWVEG